MAKQTSFLTREKNPYLLRHTQFSPLHLISFSNFPTDHITIDESHAKLSSVYQSARSLRDNRGRRRFGSAQ
ncbi:MAG: hypothetical protein AAGL18_03995, partial [Pseudomonadota bacterium]